MTVMTGRAITNAVTPGPAPSWRQEASCQGMDGELFFPVGSSPEAVRQTKEAKQVCGRCPVKDDCLVWAMRTRQAAGVWGGKTENERRTMQNRRVKAQERARNGKSAMDHILDHRLEEFLQLKGLTPKGIADAMGTNVQTVRNVQRALESMTAEALDAAMQDLEVAA